MDAIMALPLDSLDRATHLLEEVQFVLIREHAIFPYIEVTIFDGRSLLRNCVPDLAQDSWAPFVNSGAYLFGLLDALQLRAQAISLQLSAGTPLADIVNPVLEFLLHPIIMATYPYIATILALAFTVIQIENRDLGVPAALLEP